MVHVVQLADTHYDYGYEAEVETGETEGAAGGGEIYGSGDVQFG